MAYAERMIRAIREQEDPGRAARCAKFFKAFKGGYGEGDMFLGLTVPQTRKLVREFRSSPVTEYEKVLQSQWHEARLFALIALGEAFKRGDDTLREKVYRIYTANTSRVNNWDLVDTSAHHIAGKWLLDRGRNPLYELARSENLWEKRIAMIATLAFINADDFNDVFGIADVLLHDTHDLIHKAVGWMIREVGNRDRQAEERFLHPRYHSMPRTMLRYAIEKFEPELRKAYLRGEV